MGSKSNQSSSSTNTTQQYDNRTIVDDRDTYTSSSYDLSDRSTTNWDSSNRSTNTTNITGTDGGSVRIAEYNAQLLGAVSENNTDAVRTIAEFGSDSINRMGAAATDIYATAGNNQRLAWGQTVEASAGLIGQLLETSAKTTSSAERIATAAIDGFKPAENAQSETMGRLALLAAAGVAAIVILRK